MIARVALLVLVSVALVPVELAILRRVMARTEHMSVDAFVVIGPLGTVFVALVAIVPAMAIVDEAWAIFISAWILEIPYILWLLRMLRMQRGTPRRD